MSLINFEGPAPTNAADRKPRTEDVARADVEAPVHASNFAARFGKLPPFSVRDPAFWIHRLDTYFTCCGITDQVLKYQITANEIPEPFASELRDLLISMPEADPYDKLRDGILGRFAESRTQRVRRLLAGETLGDRRPSQFLRHLQHLLGDDAGPSEQDFLRELFLQRLPETTRLVLSASGTSVSLGDMASMADRMHEYAFHSVHAAARTQTLPMEKSHLAFSSGDGTSLQEAFRRLEMRVTSLADEIRRLQNDAKSSKSVGERVSRATVANSGRRFAHRSPSRSREITDGQCHFHNRFGDKAESCYKGCKHFAPKGQPNC